MRHINLLIKLLYSCCPLNIPWSLQYILATCNCIELNEPVRKNFKESAQLFSVSKLVWQVYWIWWVLDFAPVVKIIVVYAATGRGK